MSQQLQITGGAKVRNLEGAIVGSSGVLSSVGLGVAYGVATLGADGKVPSSQLPSLGSSYKGTWNAATNTPTIANGVGTAGDFYLVSTGGVWNGITFTAGQLVIYSGTVWQQAGGTAGVTSVGLAAPAAFTVSGSPVTSTGTLTLNAAGTTSQYISGAGTLITFPTNLVTTSRSVSTTSPLGGGGALSSDLTLTIQLATTSASGYLSSTDWTTFNNKQNALGYTPYNATNPAGYISGITYSNVVTALGFTPYNSTNPSGYITSSALTPYLLLSGGTLTGNLSTNAGVTITASAFFELSDIRFKNILEIKPIIDLSSIEVIKFTYKDDAKQKVRYGYSAQDIQAVLPDAVDEQDKLYINYSDIHTLKIAQLEQRIKELEAKLN
jgi:hypothetical protein